MLNSLLQRIAAGFVMTFLFACSDGGPALDTQPDSAEYQVEEKSIAELQADLTAGKISAEQLVECYLMRIATLDREGPQLNSVLALNPEALPIARALDKERRQSAARGPLHGIPVLLKDNIESADPMPTTAGALALRDNLTGRDAPLVKRLRDAGAIILGKTNLSEWANIRSPHAVSGWSALGGLTRNPYAIDRNACGSSSGSAAAVAASFAAVAVGTETDGSITCPAAVNGLVGLKPTRGLISRTLIIPLAESQDSAGPMARTVADAAALLTVLAGSDPADPATADADRHRQDYNRLLDAHNLQGKRLGVLRFATGYHPGLDAVFEESLLTLQQAGATLVEIAAMPNQELITADELSVLLTEFKQGVNQYLANSPAELPVRDLAQLIAFNRHHADSELLFFGQELFEKAEQTTADAAFVQRRARLQKLARDGLDKLMNGQQLDALVAPTTGPAWVSDLVNGDHYAGGVSSVPAVAGYPHLTVPMGQVKGLPVGLSLIGRAWHDGMLLAFAHDFEQRQAARQLPGYASSEALPDIAAGAPASHQPIRIKIHAKSR